MKPASEQGKEEDITLWAKISSNFYLMFCGEPGIDPAINRSIICNVYCQVSVA